MNCKVNACPYELKQDGYCEIHYWYSIWLKNDDINNLGIVKFLITFFPHAFKLKYGFPFYLKKILHELILSQKTGETVEDRFHAIKVFRGASKSTAVTFGYTIFCILFRLKKNIVILSASEKLAIKHLRTIKKELTDNKLIERFFGSIKYEVARDENGKWTETQIITSTGISVTSLGMEQEGRGFKEGHDRIDLLLCDDFQSEKKSGTPEVREKNLDWVNNAILPTVDDISGQVVIIGTPIALDTILENCFTEEGKKTFKCSEYPVISRYPCTQEEIDKGEVVLTWPERLPLQTIEKKLQRFRSMGKEAGFWQEYMLVVVAEDQKKFRKEYFQHISRWKFIREYGELWLEVTFEDGSREIVNVNTYAACDPAVSENITSDDSVIGYIARDYQDRIFVLKISMGKYGQRDEPLPEFRSYWDKNVVVKDRSKVQRVGSVDEFLRLIKDSDARRAAWECIAAQRWGYLEANSLRSKNGIFCTIIETPITNNEKKTTRITDTLLPYYQTYKVYHARSIETDLLEKQLEYLGKMKHDDLPDFLSAAVAISSSPQQLSREVFHQESLKPLQTKKKSHFLYQ